MVGNPPETFAPNLIRRLRTNLSASREVGRPFVSSLTARSVRPLLTARRFVGARATMVIRRTVTSTERTATTARSRQQIHLNRLTVQTGNRPTHAQSSMSAMVMAIQVQHAPCALALRLETRIRFSATPRLTQIVGRQQTTIRNATPRLTRIDVRAAPLQAVTAVMHLLHAPVIRLVAPSSRSHGVSDAHPTATRRTAVAVILMARLRPSTARAIRLRADIPNPHLK